MHAPFHGRALALAGLVTILLSGCEVQSIGSARDYPVPAGYGEDDGLGGRAFADTGGVRHVPADFVTMRLALTFDVAARRTTGRAEVRFRPVETGVPYFLMTPAVTAARLDGAEISLSNVTDPDGATTFRSLGVELARGSEHSLELDYAMPSAEVSYTSTGMAFVTSMADIGNGNFFEAYGPAGFEADQFQLSLELNLSGATATHQLFTNGRVTSTTESGRTTRWAVEFPAYMNTSGLYFHLTQTAMTVRRTEHQGLSKRIPITIYSQSQASADAALEKIHGLFTELEDTYGPYLHDSFTAYIYGSGGMEHCGATITSVSALGHELTHSWFARGVMPADGRSGWMDEAVASWRDYGYQRSGAQLSRAATNLANLSVWEIFTPRNVYVDGRALLAELDGLFASSKGGLRPVLREFFALWGGRTVTTEQFRDFLEAQAGASLGAKFDKYVYGRSSVGGIAAQSVASQAELGMHPPALTRADVLKLR